MPTKYTRSWKYNHAKKTKEEKQLESESSADKNTPEKSRQPTLLVIGDSDFANNTYFGFSGNGDLFLNAASWLTQNEQLISIRPRERKNNPLQLTRAEGSMIFLLGVIVFPAVVVLVGVRIWGRRRAL